MKSPLVLLLASLIVTPPLAAENQQPPARPTPPRVRPSRPRPVRRLPHGRRVARQPGQPDPAGQHPEYLAKQLAEFKAGKRDNAIMKGFAGTLSDADMKNVAAFYAGKQAKPGFAKNKDIVALGEKIYRGGIADKQVPACAGCHSPTGAGIPAQYPRVGRPACRLHRGPADRLPWRGSQEQRPDDRRRRPTDRQGDQGRRRLHGRPALTAHLSANGGPASLPAFFMIAALRARGAAVRTELRRQRYIAPCRLFAVTPRASWSACTATPKPARRSSCTTTTPTCRPSSAPPAARHRRLRAPGRRLRARDRGRDRHADRQERDQHHRPAPEAQAKLFSRKSFRERARRARFAFSAYRLRRRHRRHAASTTRCAKPRLG